jgi:hypothetical protein
MRLGQLRDPVEVRVDPGLEGGKRRRAGVVSRRSASGTTHGLDDVGRAGLGPTDQLGEPRQLRLPEGIEGGEGPPVGERGNGSV